MKKSLLVLAGLIFTIANIHGQQITDEKSIVKYLCKKWEGNYMMAENLKISFAGGEKMQFSFQANNSFVLTTIVNKDTVAGKWNFEKEKKRIVLLMNNKPYKYITSLTKEEFVLLDPKEVEANSKNYVVYRHLKKSE